MKRILLVLVMITAFVGTAIAADKVVVIPLNSSSESTGNWKTVSVSSVGGVAPEPTKQTQVTLAAPNTCFTKAGSSVQPIGRYATSGGEFYIMVPIQLPDGATITSFTAHICDSSASAGGTMYLYRNVADMDGLVASVGTGFAETSSTMFRKTTNAIGSGKEVVDNANYSYFIFMPVNSIAGTNFIPVSGVVTLK